MLRRVEYRPGCSLEQLLGNQQQPAVISGAMTDNEWPALRWSPEELLRRHSDMTVPVEVSIGGADYTTTYDDRDMYCPQPGSGRAFEAGVPVPLSLLLQHMRDEEQHRPGDEVCAALCSTSNCTQLLCHLVWDGHGRSKALFHESAHDLVIMVPLWFRQASPSAPAEGLVARQQQPRLYLAQKDVAEVLPALAAEGIPLGPPFAELGQRMHQRSVWLGPRGTETPLHCDPYFNLFCQVQALFRNSLRHSRFRWRIGAAFHTA